MHLSSPSLAYIMTLFLTCLFHAVSGQDPPPSTPGNSSQPHMICQPFGVCEPCPSAALSQPFCQPFGNRRLMHCTEANTSPEGTPPNTGTTPEGEHLVWEPCGRIVGKERADFYEFIPAATAHSCSAAGCENRAKQRQALTSVVIYYFTLSDRIE
ncbi:uncharacterized protein ARMOST_19696 [Armillaria ostoyae]|uniref:Uncharacterized protein n=1 Tax=Armillaria ostoyae TaxID=47428 RepID=A0A284S5A2_ARMOS|nr:uncharacterized protein ARMOST_19696 [Armillaria ostoyae]